MDFRLKNEFIELDNLLKVLELVSCGAEAKQVILAGEAKVNGEVEIRVRRKLRFKDIVEFRGQKIEILK
jgi:ribosome-associated protein